MPAEALRVYLVDVSGLDAGLTTQHFMTDTPKPISTVDPGATDASKVVGEIIADVEPVVETAIITAEPFMGTPVWKQLWESAFEWVCGFLGGALKTLTGFVFVRAQEYLALKSASSALATLQAANKSGDPGAIATANTNADQALAPVLQYIGSINNS